MANKDKINKESVFSRYSINTKPCRIAVNWAHICVSAREIPSKIHQQTSISFYDNICDKYYGAPCSLVCRLDKICPPGYPQKPVPGIS